MAGPLGLLLLVAVSVDSRAVRGQEPFSGPHQRGGTSAARATSHPQWQRIELPPGGTAPYNPDGERQVFAIQFDATGRIYIANRYNGRGNEVVLRSADEGRSWEGVGPDQDWTLKQGPNDGGFRIHPLDSNCWYLGSENRGVYATFDGGKTWEHVIEGWTPDGIGHGFTFAFHPTDAAIVYASGGVGVFRSRDRGRSWRSLGLPPSQSQWVEVDPVEPHRVYATQLWKIGDVLRSEDGGDSWRSITSGIPDGRVTPTGYFHRSAWQFHIDCQDHRKVYVTTAAGLFVSKNFGEAWEGLAPPPDRGVMSGRVIFGQNPIAPREIVTSESLGHIMLTQDAGKSWRNITGNLRTGAMPHRAFGIRVTELRFDPRNPRVLYVARSDGLYRTELPDLQRD